MDENIHSLEKSPLKLVLDPDESTREKALEGHSNDVRIVKKRKSLGPNDYRIFELSTGEVVTVPITEKTIEIQINKKSQKKFKYSKEKSKMHRHCKTT